MASRSSGFSTRHASFFAHLEMHNHELELYITLWFPNVVILKSLAKHYYKIFFSRSLVRDLLYDPSVCCSWSRLLSKRSLVIIGEIRKYSNIYFQAVLYLSEIIRLNLVAWDWIMLSFNLLNVIFLFNVNL